MIFAVVLTLTAIIFATIAWRDLRLAISLTLFALPSYLIRFEVGPLPMTLLEVLVLIVIVRFVIAVIMKKQTVEYKGWFVWPIIIFLLAATIGVVVAPDKLAALGIWRAYFVEPILFFFVVRSTLKNTQHVNGALKALGCSAVVVSVLGLLQWITNIGIPAPWDFERRIVSVFDFPNAVGLYLGPIVTIALITLFEKIKNQYTKSQTNLKHQNKKTDIAFWLAVAILGGLTIIAAKTEAAYAAIPASLLIVSFFHRRARRYTIPLAAIGLVAAMMITPVRQKLTLHDYSGEVRRTQWTETLAMLKDHPLFGAGLSGYPTVFAPYHHAEWVEVFQYPHNIILNIWSELGLLGLLAFLLLAVHVLRSSPLLTKEGTGVVLVVLAALLEMTIHGLVDVPYFKNDLALMTWTLLALLTISAGLDRSAQK